MIDHNERYCRECNDVFAIAGGRLNPERCPCCGTLSVEGELVEVNKQLDIMRAEVLHGAEVCHDAVARAEKAKVEVERWKTKAESEYRRGLDEGRSCQAILEIQGREKFIKEEADIRTELLAACRAARDVINEWLPIDCHKDQREAWEQLKRVIREAESK